MKGCSHWHHMTLAIRYLEKVESLRLVKSKRNNIFGIFSKDSPKLWPFSICCALYAEKYMIKVLLSEDKVVMQTGLRTWSGINSHQIMNFIEFRSDRKQVALKKKFSRIWYANEMLCLDNFSHLLRDLD